MPGRFEDVVSAHVVVLADFLPGSLTRIARQVNHRFHTGRGGEDGIEVGQVADDRIAEVGHREAVEAANVVSVA